MDYFTGYNSIILVLLSLVPAFMVGAFYFFVIRKKIEKKLKKEYNHRKLTEMLSLLEGEKEAIERQTTDETKSYSSESKGTLAEEPFVPYSSRQSPVHAEEADLKRINELSLLIDKMRASAAVENIYIIVKDLLPKVVNARKAGYSTKYYMEQIHKTLSL